MSPLPCDRESDADAGIETAKQPSRARIDAVDRRSADPCNPERALAISDCERARGQLCHSDHAVSGRVDSSETVSTRRHAALRADADREDGTAGEQESGGYEPAR